MKAVRYQAPGDFAVTDVPIPPVRPLDVLIKVHQSGVCGTDVHMHHGTYIGVYPLTPGHETIGEIEEGRHRGHALSAWAARHGQPEYLLRPMRILPCWPAGSVCQH